MFTIPAPYDKIAAAIVVFLFAWTVPASLLARYIARPPASSAWWKRLLFDLFVDTPAWVAALGRSGIGGGILNLPGVPSRLPVDNPTPGASPPAPPPPVRPG